MLRGLAAIAVTRAATRCFKRGHQLLHVADTRARRGSRRLASCSALPIQRSTICAVAPALDVARVVRDRAVQVLDRVGRSERAVQRAVDAQRRAASASRPAPRAGSRRRPDDAWLSEVASRSSCRLASSASCAVPGVAHGAPDAGVQFLGQVLEHVAALVLLAALDERAWRRRTRRSPGAAPCRRRSPTAAARRHRARARSDRGAASARRACSRCCPRGGPARACCPGYRCPGRPGRRGPEVDAVDHHHRQLQPSIRARQPLCSCSCSRPRSGATPRSWTPTAPSRRPAASSVRA